jgi:SAM-dependent MidA family methyltransferase
VHRVVGTSGGLRELHVAWRDGWFSFEEGPLSSRLLAERLAGIEAAATPGHISDIGLAAPTWLARVGARLERGFVLVIDYGHPAADLYGARRARGSLLAYRDHGVHDAVLEAVGRQDLTAHVDVTALERAAASAGLRPAGATSQARFLTALGLGEMLADLGRRPDVPVSTYVEARASVARLLDPRHLGAFRVLAWSHGVEGDEPLPGFAQDG